VRRLCVRYAGTSGIGSFSEIFDGTSELCSFKKIVRVSIFNHFFIALKRDPVKSHRYYTVFIMLTVVYR